MTKGWFAQNLMGILLAMAGAFGGYMTGRSETKEITGRLDRTIDRVTDLERAKVANEQKATCSTRVMDQLTAEAGVTPVCSIP